MKKYFQFGILFPACSGKLRGLELEQCDNEILKSSFRFSRNIKKNPVRVEVHVSVRYYTRSKPLKHLRIFRGDLIRNPHTRPHHIQ